MDPLRPLPSRATQGKPTQYITKRQEFYGREFRLTPDVLIPRPETEHVVEAALTVLRGQDRGVLRLLDIGAGSGAIAITLALETGARVAATDISPAAIAVATRNAETLGARVDFVVCDLMSAMADHSIDLIVSNPPYVPLAQREFLQREVRDFEPPVALFGGERGFEIYDRIAADAPRVLRPGGWLILELGFGCEPHVSTLLWQLAQPPHRARPCRHPACSSCPSGVALSAVRSFVKDESPGSYQIC